MQTFLALNLTSKENANATDHFSEVKMLIIQLFSPLLRSLERNTSYPAQNV